MNSLEFNLRRCEEHIHECLQRSKGRDWIALITGSAILSLGFFMIACIGTIVGLDPIANIFMVLGGGITSIIPLGMNRTRLFWKSQWELRAAEWIELRNSIAQRIQERDSFQ